MSRLRWHRITVGGNVKILGLHACTIAATVWIVIGCATPYQPRGFRGGYSDYRVSADVFSVSFRGNSSTREEVVEEFLLRRASELTLEHEYVYFVVLAEKGRTRTSSVGYSSVKVPIVSPGSSIQIRCFRDRPPDSESPIDAAEFLRFNFPEALEELLPTGSTSSP